MCQLSVVNGRQVRHHPLVPCNDVTVKAKKNQSCKIVSLVAMCITLLSVKLLSVKVLQVESTRASEWPTSTGWIDPTSLPYHCPSCPIFDTYKKRPQLHEMSVLRTSRTISRTLRPIRQITRTMASTTAKFEWLVIVPDHGGVLDKRMEIRPYSFHI